MKRFLSLSGFVLILIFVLTFNLLVFSSLKNSATTDEGIHLYAGYSYLTKNDFRLDPEHPPVLKELSAVPLLFFKNLNNPLDGLWDKAGNFYYDSWQEARKLSGEFFYSLGNNPNSLLFWGRVPFIILTLILGYAVYRWANKLYGQKAGVFAAFLILLMPNILAHGTLINTDLGLTLFLFLAVYFWSKFLKSTGWRTSWASLVLAGIIAGLTFSSKFTSVILIPILVILGLVKIFTDKSSKQWLRYFLGFIGVLVIGYLIIWASYGFSIDAAPKPL